MWCFVSPEQSAGFKAYFKSVIHLDKNKIRGQSMVGYND